MNTQQNIIQKVAGQNILSLLGVPDDAPEEQKANILNNAASLILEHITERIDARLPQEKKEEFQRIFSGHGTEEEKAAFIETYVPDFEDILAREVLFFKSIALIIAEQGE